MHGLVSMSELARQMFNVSIETGQVMFVVTVVLRRHLSALLNYFS